MARVGFIVNPASGKGRGRRKWEAAVRELASKADFSVWYTEHPGHATDLARRAADAGFTRVAAVGGDGTLGEVADGLAGTGTTLAIVPGGTGNDLVRALGVPMELKAAAELALTGKSRRIDLGRITPQRHFINVAGVGFDAEVAQTVNRYPKYLGGTIPYVAGIVVTLLRYQPYPLELEIDGKHLFRNALLVAIANSCFYGGGMQICPEAKVDDGYFDVCIGGDVGRLDVLRLVPAIYSGGHRTHPKVELLRAKRIEIRSSQPVSTAADGEVIGTVPRTFECLPGHLEIVVPESKSPVWS
jgi:diacylglycerol kinase (ATP)